jgi:hypothetical protein
MSYALRRHRKLEAELIDQSGLRPHSKEWYDYYRREFRRFVASETHTGLRMPIEVCRYLMRERGARPADAFSSLGSGK